MNTQTAPADTTTPFAGPAIHDGGIASVSRAPEA